MRPVRWLAGFAAVDADAGQDVAVTITVPARAFEHWDVDAGAWALEPGTFGLAAGPSSAMLPLCTEIEMLPDASTARSAG